MHGRFGYAELYGDLACREHATTAQPLVSTCQFVGLANERDLLQIEGLAFPGAPSVTVQNVGNLAVAVLVEQLIDGDDEFRFELAYLGDWQRPFEYQGACGPAGQSHMGGDGLRLEQGYIVDEQAHDAFALTKVDARIIPDLWQLLGKTKNPLAGLGAERRSLLLAAAFVFVGSFGMTAQLVVPFGLKRIGDESVVGVYLHVTSAAQRLEAACRRGISIGAASYRSIASILQTGLDKAFLPDTTPDAEPIRHGNIRGRSYYH